MSPSRPHRAAFSTNNELIGGWHPGQVDKCLASPFPFPIGSLGLVPGCRNVWGQVNARGRFRSPFCRGQLDTVLLAIYFPDRKINLFPGSS